MKPTITTLLALLFSASIFSQNIVWENSVGGSMDDGGSSISGTFDGGYIVAGWSESVDGDIHGHHGFSAWADALVVRYTADGDTLWTKSLGDLEVIRDLIYLSTAMVVLQSRGIACLMMEM